MRELRSGDRWSRLLCLRGGLGSCSWTNTALPARGKQHPSWTILRPHWVDHLLKIPVLNLRYARTGCAKNAKNVKGMPFPMYGVSFLTISHASMTLNFKYSKRIFTHSRLKQVFATIPYKMAKLLMFFHWSTQHGCTIVHDPYAVAIVENNATPTDNDTPTLNKNVLS